MGWAKYQEDNVSRFWRDADTRVRMDKTPAPETTATKNSDQELAGLRSLRNQLAQAPTDPALQKAFHAEKNRLMRLGISTGDILDVIHGENQNHRVTGKITLQKTGEKEMLKEFTVVAARPLPVIVLADVSGSMTDDGKIEMLNRSIREMVAAFRNEDDLRAEIHVGVITFGGSKAEARHPLAAAKDLVWEDLKATGKTPLASAFSLATEWLENRDIIPARAYAPTIVLVSDGQPNLGDPWEQELQKLLASPRSKKAQRLAFAMGAGADEDVLKAFIANPEIPLLRSNDAAHLSRFFRFVTMSVCSRVASADPNQPLPIATFDLEQFEDF
jgi:uncharacterized protein YegL